MSRFKAGFEMGTAPKCASEALFGIQDAMRMLDSKQTVVTLACLSSSGNGLPGGYTYMCQGLAGESYRGGSERVASSSQKGFTKRRSCFDGYWFFENCRFSNRT